MPSTPKNIAVLITCHNRVKTTLHCLKAFFLAVKNSEWIIEVYLVDDGSSDGTTESVKVSYPQVHIIPGDGSLYWCGGMRRAWKTAALHADYSFYLLLNDDVAVNNTFLEDLFQDYTKISNQLETSLITGACCDPITGEFTYGGRDNKQLLIPSGEPQKCRYIHGNIVLIPREIYKTIGGLSKSFTHAFGDTDYGLRSIEAGFSCWTTSAYIGTCQQHKIKGPWSSSKVPLKQRWDLFLEPQGLNFKEFIIFRRRHWPLRWMLDVVKVCTQVLLPQPFEWFSQRKIIRISANKDSNFEVRKNE